MKKCPDCRVSVGERHQSGCDVERCILCGGQAISCGCEPSESDGFLKWCGEWPGVAECVEFGWYCKMVDGQGWVQCDKSDPEAVEDLNRLITETVWDKNLKKRVMRTS